MKRRILFPLLCILLLCCALFSSCQKELCLNDYVSERRENVYIGESDGVTLKIQTGEREAPYASDGVKGETSPLLEAFLSLEESEQAPVLQLCINGKNYGGEMNFDKVKKVYSYSESVICDEESISATVTVGEESYTFTAENKRTKEHLSDESVLSLLQEKEKELFGSLTQGNRLSGELAVRFLYDDGCYFYAAVTERSGKITALLLNATSGEVLARKVLNG